MRLNRWIWALGLGISCIPFSALAEDMASYEATNPEQPPQESAPSAPTAEDLLQKAQSPISDLISLPFQENLNFGLGPFDRTQSVLNIQPILPIGFEHFNLILRPILPVIDQPDVLTHEFSTFGLGDLNCSFFFSPKSSKRVTWGVGPILSIPTATESELGTGKWSIGPAVVVVWTPPSWVLGVLANQLWSFAGSGGRPSVSQLLLQPFVTFSFPKGWYLVSTPIFTSDWNAAAGQGWTIPLGGGFGKIFSIAEQTMNANIQAFGYADRPELGPDWTLRLTFQFLFPRG